MRDVFRSGVLLTLVLFACSATYSLWPHSQQRVDAGVPRELVYLEDSGAQRIVRQSIAACSGHITNNTNHTNYASLADSDVIVPNPSTAGRTTVGYIIARTHDGSLACTANDFFDLTLWSARNRVPVSVFTEGPGVYRFVFTPKVPGEFVLCTTLFFTSQANVLRTWPEGADGPDWTEDEWADLSRSLNVLRHKDTAEWCDNPYAEKTKKCQPLTVSGEIHLPKEPCGNHWADSTGLAGSWVKAEKEACYPGLCEGDLAFMASDGWVWVPDTCYLRLYNKESAWDCLNGKRILWFGDSTLKQPATNLAENVLGVPALKRSYNYMRSFCPQGEKILKRSYRKKLIKAGQRGCAGPFEHRQWKATRNNPTAPHQNVSLQFLWGGGKTIYDQKSLHPRGMELLTEDTEARKVFFDLLSGDIPDVVIMHHYAWDSVAQFHPTEFEATLKAIIDVVLANPGTVLHWDSAHPSCGSDRFDHNTSLCVEAIANKLNTAGARRNVHRMDQFFRREYPDEPRITFGNRYAMAHPLSFGQQFCHFGNHFGTHPAACHSLMPEKPATCYRDWLADKYESTVWLNKICTNPPKTQGDGTIEVCKGGAAFLNSFFFLKATSARYGVR